jgi:hypothetical protein
VRAGAFVAAALLLAPGPVVVLFGIPVPVLDAAGFILFVGIAALNRARPARALSAELQP